MPARARTLGRLVPACVVLAGRAPVAMLASTRSVFREGGGLPHQAGQEDASRRLIQTA
jgi:hypothetical protein